MSSKWFSLLTLTVCCIYLVELNQQVAGSSTDSYSSCCSCGSKVGGSSNFVDPNPPFAKRHLLNFAQHRRPQLSKVAAGELTSQIARESSAAAARLVNSAPLNEAIRAMAMPVVPIQKTADVLSQVESERRDTIVQRLVGARGRAVRAALNRHLRQWHPGNTPQTDTAELTHSQPPTPISSLQPPPHLNLTSAIVRGVQSFFARDQRPSAPKIKFSFPDIESPYFGRPSRGLNATLTHALAHGCMDCWQGRDLDIEIIFESKKEPKRQPFIQYQMEQLTNRMRFDGRYIGKMKRAVQLWDFSAFNCRAIAGMTDRRCDYVPLWLTDYYPELHPGEVSSLKRKEPLLDALFFGAMCPSRIPMCRKLASSNKKIECAENLYGADLERKILSSRLVFIEHCYPGGVLTVHRINHVLSLGVPIVASRSADPQLDAMYEKMGVVFAKNDLADEVLQILDNKVTLENARVAAAKYNDFKQTTLEPVCGLLKQLCIDIKSKQR